MYKVILDTDIGDDIDDSFALGLALKNPLFDIKAITTVFKNTVARAKQAKELVKLSGKDIPVYVGEVYPINGVITGFSMDQGDLATILPCQYDKSMDNNEVLDGAVDTIIRLAKEYSGELIIVPIGPMTNVAKALVKDPSIASDIKAIYSMGGWFTNFTPEWNVICDPEALDIVYKSNIPFYAVGLDVTLQCPLEGGLFESLRESHDPMTKIIFKWLDKWFDYFHFDKSVLHDPLAVSTMIDPNICKFEEMYVKVVLEGEKRAAILTCKEPLEGYNLINVATSVKKDEFFKIISKTFA